MKMKTIIKPFVACLVFVSSMLAISILVQLVFRVLGIANATLMLSLSSVLSGAFTVAVLSGMSMIRWKDTFDFSRLSMGRSLGILFFFLFLIVGLNLLSEQFDLEDNNAEMTMNLVHTPWGVLVLAVVAPVVEELVFREAIIGWMLRRGGGAMVSILFSSVAFGLIHANPAQIPFAFIMGLLLGYLYWKTGNIVLSSVLHILNNGLAVFLLLAYGEDTRWTDFFYDATSAIVVSSLMLVLGVCGICRLTMSQKDS